MSGIRHCRLLFEKSTADKLGVTHKTLVECDFDTLDWQAHPMAILGNAVRNWVNLTEEGVKAFEGSGRELDVAALSVYTSMQSLKPWDVANLVFTQVQVEGILVPSERDLYRCEIY